MLRKVQEINFLKNIQRICQFFYPNVQFHEYKVTGERNTLALNWFFSLILRTVKTPSFRVFLSCQKFCLWHRNV